jgi:hypothetical protein
MREEQRCDHRHRQAGLEELEARKELDVEHGPDHPNGDA